MNPLVKKIYEKHVNQILKPAEFYQDKHSHLKPTNVHGFQAGVLEVLGNYGIKAKITGKTKLWDEK